MRSLLDVNILIALLDAGHSLHRAAATWFEANARAGWASCPITQNGCLRILASPSYSSPTPIALVAERLREATATRVHEFWPDDVSILDSALIDPSRIHRPNQLTDTYLLALACKKGARLVTFDHGISLEAVRGAKQGNLLKI